MDNTRSRRQSKTETSLMERQNNAKQKIAFYNNNKKAQNAKLAMLNRNIKGRS